MYLGLIQILYHSPDGSDWSYFTDSSMLDESLLGMERYADGHPVLEPHFRALWWSWEAEKIVTERMGLQWPY